MRHRKGAGLSRALRAGATGFMLWASLLSASAEERELKIGYMKNPIQDASLDMMQKWAKASGVKLTPVPMAYSVFMEKVTATLASESLPAAGSAADRVHIGKELYYTSIGEFDPPAVGHSTVKGRGGIADPAVGRHGPAAAPTKIRDSPTPVPAFYRTPVPR